MKNDSIYKNRGRAPGTEGLNQKRQMFLASQVHLEFGQRIQAAQSRSSPYALGPSDPALVDLDLAQQAEVGEHLARSQND